MHTESRKKPNLPPAATSLCITFLIIQHRCEVSHIVCIFPYATSPDLHASEFSLSEIFCTIPEPSSKLVQNLRNFPLAHSRGTRTFSGRCMYITYMQ